MAIVLQQNKLSGLVPKPSHEGQEAASEVAVFLVQPGRPGHVRLHALPLHQHALPPEATESGKLFQPGDAHASGDTDVKSAQRSVC